MRFWRNVDGSWTSELTATPQAGQTAYTFDASTCTLENDASSTIGARDLENNSVRVPNAFLEKVLADGDWEGLPTPAEIERFVAQERKADR